MALSRRMVYCFQPQVVDNHEPRAMSLQCPGVLIDGLQVNCVSYDQMAWLVGIVGLITAWWAVRQPARQRSNALLAALVLLVIGVTLWQDGANPARLPSFAMPQTSPNEGKTLGGSLTYRDLRWETREGQPWLLGSLENPTRNNFERLTVVFEFFDAAGNSLGYLNYPSSALGSGQTLQLAMPVTLSGAHSFKLVRVNLN